MAVCRPPVANDRRRLSAAPGDALQELDILEPDAALPQGAPDADLCRDISVEREGRGTVLRLPLYGHRGGAGLEQLCEREVAPLLQRLLAGESCAVIAYGQTGARLWCLLAQSQLGIQRAWCQAQAMPHAAALGTCFIPAKTALLPHQARARASPWARSVTTMGRRRSRTRVGACGQQGGAAG